MFNRERLWMKEGGRGLEEGNTSQNEAAVEFA